MKKFLINICIFGGFLLGFLVVCDAITTYAFHQKHTRKYSVWNDILHTDIDADLLIMGNSRAWKQYSTYILDSILNVNSYNIGMDGSCFNRQVKRYEIYRHYQRRKPDYIIQNVEFFTLERTVGYEREQFMPYMMYSYFREKVMQEEPFSFAELYIPMYRYYMNNFYEDYTKYDFPLYKGYYADDEEWNPNELKQVEPYNAIVDTTTLLMFEDFLLRTKQDSILLILVIAPMHVEATRIVLNNDEICQMYKDMAHKYDVPLLDYSELPACVDTTYFYNATHLNRLGAELFTTQLAHDLDSLGLIKKE